MRRPHPVEPLRRGDLRTRATQALETTAAPLGRALRSRRAGAEKSIAHHRVLNAPATINLSSPDLADGQEIPDRFCGIGIGQGISPALNWENVPEGTQRLLLVLEDLDFPSAAHTGIHMAAVLDSSGSSGSIVERELSGRSSRFAFVRSYDGRAGYRPPRPLPGHGTHRYVLHLFALGAPITPPPDADIAGLVRRIPADQVLARGELTVTKEG